MRLATMLLCLTMGFATLSPADEAAAPARPEFDVLIAGGQVCPDGETEPFAADIGVRDGRIAAIGALKGRTAARTIDAAGLVVVPGFIDTHTHADGGGALPEYLLQGVTTIVVGNCGRSRSVTDVEGYFTSVAEDLGPNLVGLIGHNSLRASVELTGKEPTAEQLAAMQQRAEAAMRAGAFGMSTGLTYYSGYNSATEEIIAIAKAIAKHGGVYASHMRAENAGVLDAVDEAIRIGRESGCTVQISHAKVAGPASWGLVGEYLRRVDEANAAGMTVRLDLYPYTASQTGINALFPKWALDTWDEALANERERVEKEIEELLTNRGGPKAVFMVSGPFRFQYLSDVVESLGKSPVDVLINDIGPGNASAVYHMMREEDVREFLQHPELMIGSDGPSRTHPRGHGTYPRFWARYARDLGMFGVREGVMKTSTLAARQFGLLEQQRGAIREGFHADIVVFDFDRIVDGATFQEPTLPPRGVQHVLVNGVPAIDGGEYNGATAGRVLRFTDSRKAVAANGK